MLDKLKDKASGLKDKVTDMKDNIWGEEQKKIIQEFKDAGVNKIKEILDNTNNSTKVFLKAGYKLEGVKVTLGVPPDIVACFKFEHKISKEERDQIYEDTKSNTIIHLIVSCLLKAEDFYDAVKMGEYKLASVDITLGLLPGITVGFGK